MGAWNVKVAISQRGLVLIVVKVALSRCIVLSVVRSMISHVLNLTRRIAPMKTTVVIECTLSGCKNHDGSCMGCDLEKIDINVDGFCAMYENRFTGDCFQDSVEVR